MNSKIFALKALIAYAVTITYSHFIPKQITVIGKCLDIVTVLTMFVGLILLFMSPPAYFKQPTPALFKYACISLGISMLFLAIITWII